MRTILLLTISNIFMTFAWYGHLKYRSEALWKVILASWGIAFFEYCFQVPANRIGSYEFSSRPSRNSSPSPSSPSFRLPTSARNFAGITPQASPASAWPYFSSFTNGRRFTKIQCTHSNRANRMHRQNRVISRQEISHATQSFRSLVRRPEIRQRLHLHGQWRTQANAIFVQHTFRKRRRHQP